MNPSQPGPGYFPEWGLKPCPRVRRKARASYPRNRVFPRVGIETPWSERSRCPCSREPGTGCFPEWGLKPRIDGEELVFDEDPRNRVFPRVGIETSRLLRAFGSWEGSRTRVFPRVGIETTPCGGTAPPPPTAGTGCFPAWGLKHYGAAGGLADARATGTGCFPEWGLKQVAGLVGLPDVKRPRNRVFPRVGIETRWRQTRRCSSRTSPEQGVSPSGD